MKKIKVLIVDDSILIQSILSKILNADNDIIVVGMAENPIIARELIKILKPDVIILDIEMPIMDGLTFLSKLMRLNPMPVIMCSAFTPHCKEVTLEAFNLGVVDIINKPISESPEVIAKKVKNAATAKINAVRTISDMNTPLMVNDNYENLNNSIIAIGSSTGGTEALSAIFQVLPHNIPPVVVTQHLPDGFTKLFVERINKTSKLNIKVAEHGESLRSSHVYVAPAKHHILIERKENKFIVNLDQTIDGIHRPSVDVMFISIAKECAKNATGVLLTGMGADGAKGLLELKNRGAQTIVQDEATSVVWGMPGTAYELGAASEVLPLQSIPQALIDRLNRSI